MAEIDMLATEMAEFLGAVAGIYLLFGMRLPVAVPVATGLGGRPRALDPSKVQIAQQLYHDKTNSIADTCRTLRISRATLYRYMKIGTGKPT